jgi:hypothetical protein
MKAIIPTLFHKIASALRERCDLLLEMLALRHQLAVLERSVKRPQFSPLDRCVWIVLSTLWPRWPYALEIMQADTVRRWRRQGVRHHLRWPCGRKRSGRPAIVSETRALIGHLSRDHVLWGAPRIHGELARLGIKVSRTTVAKYMSRRPYPPSPTWRTCICNHASELMGREASAELLQRVCALSARFLMALRCWLDRGVAGERERDSWYGRYGAVILFIPLSDTVSMPVLWTPNVKARIAMSERSPPVSGWSSHGDLSVAEAHRCGEGRRVYSLVFYGTFGEVCLHPATDASPLERAEERGLTASRSVIRQQDELLVRTPICGGFVVSAKPTCQGMSASFSSCGTFVNGRRSSRPN